MRLIDADALIQDMIDKRIPFNADVNEAILSARTIGNYAEYVDRVWEIAYERGKEDALQWTKCIDRLPSKNDFYLVWIGQPWLIPRFRWVDKAYYCDGKWLGIQEDAKVNAWLPLPQYESEEE